VPDEAHQLPGQLGAAVVRFITTAECGHAGKADTVFDDPENVAVRKVLGFCSAEIGRLGIKALANRSVAASVVAVAERAVIGEMQPAIALNFRRIRNRICRRMRFRRHCQPSRGARNCGFERTRLCPGAETVMQDTDRPRGEEADRDQQNQEQQSSALHLPRVYYVPEFCYQFRCLKAGGDARGDFAVFVFDDDDKIAGQWNTFAGDGEGIVPLKARCEFVRGGAGRI
jgi:hypothetical protein